MCDALTNRLTGNVNELSVANKHFNEENLQRHADFAELAHIVKEQEAVLALERQVLELDPQFLERETHHREVARAAVIEEKTAQAIQHWHREHEVAQTAKETDTEQLNASIADAKHELHLANSQLKMHIYDAVKRGIH